MIDHMGSVACGMPERPRAFASDQPEPIARTNTGNSTFSLADHTTTTTAAALTVPSRAPTLSASASASSESLPTEPHLSDSDSPLQLPSSSSAVISAADDVSIGGKSSFTAKIQNADGSAELTLPESSSRHRSMSVGDETSSSAANGAGSTPCGGKDVSCPVVETPVMEREPVSTSTLEVRTAPKRQVRTGEVNCRWLYNQVQASRGMILIDTRPRDVYEEDTIPSAISVPPMEGCRTLDDVEGGMMAEQRYLFSAKKRKLRDVVLFGDAVKRSASEDGDDTQGSSWLRHLEKLIIEDGLVTSIKLLCDGFITFKYRYPFYTSAALLDEIAVHLTRTKSGTHNLNYPNEILEGFLFLGNMWHAQSKQVVSHLGITHIVNASLDVGNTFENDGIKYLNVTIKDRPEADISSY
ncbi:hypothetical protein BBJ28_00010515, partial [Nothophytophthora sp. Chile5]